MFTAALFTIAKTWKQPKCPTTEEWVKKMWYMYVCVYIYIFRYSYFYIHTHSEILLSHKEEGNNAICSSMDGPRDDHTK